MAALESSISIFSKVSKVTLVLASSWHTGRMSTEHHVGHLWARPRDGRYLSPSHSIFSGPKNRTKQNTPHNTKTESLLPCFHLSLLFYPNSSFCCQNSWAGIVCLFPVFLFIRSVISVFHFLSLLKAISDLIVKIQWHLLSSHLISLLCILPFLSTLTAHA